MMVRYASMHYAPGKAPIMHPPQEWLQLVEAAVKHAVAVAREFWSACYPGRQQPRYLASLYYDGLQQQALDRLAAAEAATGKHAELIRREATLWGRFSPGCKEAPQASQCGVWV